MRDIRSGHWQRDRGPIKTNCDRYKNDIKLIWNLLYDPLLLVLPSDFIEDFDFAPYPATILKSRSIFDICDTPNP